MSYLAYMNTTQWYLNKNTKHNSQEGILWKSPAKKRRQFCLDHKNVNSDADLSLYDILGDIRW